MTMNGICQTESGLIWEYINEAESDLLYEEIFERNVYLKHGIAIHCDSVIIDVGANIGLFSLFTLNYCRPDDSSKPPQYHGKLIAVEPIPLNYEVLCRNITSLMPTAKLVQAAVGNLEDNTLSSTFVFSYGQPGESTRHSDETQKRRLALHKVAMKCTIPEVQEAALDYFSNKRSFCEYSKGISSTPNDTEGKYCRLGEPPVDDNHHESVVSSEEINLGTTTIRSHSFEVEDETTDTVTFQCTMRSLEDILNEHDDYLGAASIDLVKIDVEGDELHALEGIGDKWWPRINQVVVEVYDIDNRLTAIVDLLSSKGFANVHVDQQTIEESANGFISFVPVELKLFYVYALRA